MTLEKGVRLGRYEILAPVGAGGMGEVYRARDTQIGRDVAIKVLPPEFAREPDRLRRFEQEARAVGALSHPNVLAIYDVGSYEGAPYLVAELLKGETLRERLAGGRLSTRKAVDVAIQIARGLAAAHDQGIVHRDLKPENLFCTSDDRIKILDFGLAKLSQPLSADSLATVATIQRELTSAGTVLGTVGYMSPEQVRGQSVDHRSDIFSFGAILYEILTGTRAFAGDTNADTMTAILREDPPEISEVNQSISPPLARIVRHCLEKRPEERFQSARDVGFALESMTLPSQSFVAETRKRRPDLARPLALALGGLAVAALAALVFAAGRVTATRRMPSFQQLTFRRGAVREARFAPDGQTVFYSAAWEGGRPEIFSATPGTPESRAVGLTGTRLIAAGASELAVLLVPGLGGEGTLARAPLGTVAPREVLEHVEYADWTRDGSAFAVVREVDGRDQLDYPVGKTLYQTAGWVGNPRISPDGTLVAFEDHPFGGDNRGAIAVVSRSGDVRTLSPDWAEISGLAWRANGKEVWFSAAKMGASLELHAVTLSGHERTVERVVGRLLLKDLGRDDRALLTHSRVRWEVLGLPPGESRERDFSWLDGTFAADLSADGKLLLFGESGEGGGPAYSVYLRRTDGAPPIRLGDGLATSLSPDTRWAISLLHTEPPQLVILPTGAGEARTMPRGTIAEYHWAWWFPSGSRILIFGNETGKQRRLFSQELGAGDPRPITPEGVSAPSTSVISPDGSRFFATCPKGIDASYCLFPAEGGQPEPIHGLLAGERPLRWSADGRSLFVRGPRFGVPLKIARLDLASGARQPLKELGPVDPGGVAGVREVLLTPDGASYVYHYQRSLSDLYVATGLQ